MLNTYKLVFLNPAGNPEDEEIEYVSAESREAARDEAEAILARHPFNDVSLISIELVSTGDLYVTNNAP